jgi:DNA replication protein DnaC
MTHEELVVNLRKLNLNATASGYIEASRAAEKARLTYEQYLAGLAENEVAHKSDQRIKRLSKEANLPLEKYLDGYDFAMRTGFTATDFRRLAGGDFVKDGANIVFYGSFGVGKTHLAIALVRELVKMNIRCYFTSTHTLIEQLLEAKRNLLLLPLYKKLERYDLLICDELGYVAQTQDGADLFFQLISQRSERKSMLITTNLTYSQWDKVLVNPLNTAAAVERIVCKCETFNITGPGYRIEEAKKRQAAKINLTDKPA